MIGYGVAHSNGKPLATKGSLRAQGEWTAGSDVTGTGSHVIWSGKPLTSHEKGIAGSGNRKSRVLGGETADQVENGMVGAGWGKTAEKRGRKVQSPIIASGEVLDSKKRRHVGKQKMI